MPEPLILQTKVARQRIVIEYDWEGKDICISTEVKDEEGNWHTWGIEEKDGSIAYIWIDEQFLPKFTCWLLQLCKELQKEIQEELPVKIEWLAQVQRLLEER